MVVEPRRDEPKSGGEGEQRQAEGRDNDGQNGVPLLDIYAPGLYARFGGGFESYRKGVVQFLGGAAVVRVLKEIPGLAAETRARMILLPWPRHVLVVLILRFRLFRVSLLVLVYGDIAALE